MEGEEGWESDFQNFLILLLRVLLLDLGRSGFRSLIFFFLNWRERADQLGGHLKSWLEKNKGMWAARLRLC